MQLLLSNGDKLLSNGYQASNQAYKLTTEKEEYWIQYPLTYFSDYNNDDYAVVLLVKKVYSENDIHQVYDKEKAIRIGWTFPIEALQSDAHEEAQNPHFLKYASVALNLLCLGIADVYRKTPDASVQRFDLRITDFYHEDSIVFVYKKQLLSECTSNYKQYLPGFMKYGYFFQCLTNPSGMSDISGMENVADKAQQRLQLEKLSKNLENENFIYEIISNLLPYEPNAFTSFFYQYQLIELIMEKIWIKQLDPLKNTIQKNLTNIFEIKDSIYQLSQMSSEQVRLNLLFDQYLKDATHHQALSSKCETFLTLNGKTVNAAISKNLYSVRNFLFHNFRAIQKNSESVVPEISSFFMYSLANILINYEEK